MPNKTTKANHTLILLSLLSIGALYQFKGYSNDVSVRKFGNALSELGRSIMEHCNDNQEEVSPEQIIAGFIEKTQGSLDEEIAALKLAISNEEKSYKRIQQDTFNKSLQKSKRAAKQYKNNMNADSELLSQSIYELKRELNDKLTQQQSLRLINQKVS